MIVLSALVCRELAFTRWIRASWREGQRVTKGVDQRPASRKLGITDRQLCVPAGISLFPPRPAGLSRRPPECHVRSQEPSLQGCLWTRTMCPIRGARLP